MRQRMQQLVDDYLARQAQVISPNTVSYMKSALGQFARWRDSSGRSPSTLKAWEVEDYLIGPDGAASRLSAGTFNIHKVHVTKFLKWGIPRKLWPADVIPEVPNRQTQPKEMLRIPSEHMDAMMHRAQPYERWALALLRYTLGREQEVLSRKVGHLNEEDGFIDWFRTKGRRKDPKQKLDRLPIEEELMVEWRRWLPVYEQLCGELRNDWYLLPQRTGRPGGQAWLPDTWKYDPLRKPTRLSRLVKGEVAKLYPDMTPEQLEGVGSHTMRRSGGVELRDSLRAEGVPDADHIVMAWYGHADLSTTYGYWGLDFHRDYRDKVAKGRRRRKPAEQVTELRAVEDAG